MRKYSRARPAITLHFTRQPDDPIIMVALANRPPHDIILLPEGVTDEQMYLLVRAYTKDLTRLELLELNHSKGVGAPTPTPN
jgi:hypothetical protein